MEHVQIGFDWWQEQRSNTFHGDTNMLRNFVLPKHILFAVLIPYLVGAGTVTESIRMSDPILDRSFHVIIVAEAIELSPGPYTNTNLPCGLFRVDQVIRGHLCSAMAKVFWEADKTLEDFEPWEDDMPEEWKNCFYLRPLRQEWYGRSFEGPQLGEKYIFFALQQRPKDSIPSTLQAIRTIRYSEENLKLIVQNMAPADRNPRIQAYIFVGLVLSCPSVLCFVLLSVLSNYQRKKGFLLCALVIALASLLLYMFYEWGIRSGGIRIDLMLLYPVLIMNVLFLVFAMVMFLASRRKQTRESAA